MIAPRTKTPYPENVKLAKLLLVEGETPAHFFDELATQLGIGDTIEIRSFGGNENLLRNLIALVKGHGFSKTVKSLGIIRDAEADADAARKSVADAVERSKLPAGISWKAFILPDNSRPGMIETLCLDSVARKPFFHCIDDFINSARTHGATALSAKLPNICLLKGSHKAYQAQ
jgi:hypothetical protein